MRLRWRQLLSCRCYISLPFVQKLEAFELAIPGFLAHVPDSVESGIVNTLTLLKTVI